MTADAGSGLARTLRHLYDGRPRRVAERLALDRPIASAHDILAGWATPDRTVVSAGTASATIRTESASEYRRATAHAEPWILGAFVEDCRADDVVWDVGANVGLYAMLAADIVDGGTVVAVEPHPANVDALRANRWINDADGVEIAPVVVADADGPQALSVTDMTEPGLGLHALRGEAGDESIVVAGRTGESLADEYGPPDVLKIDVEGAELVVLESMGPALESCRVVYVEVHADPEHPNSIHNYGGSPEDVRECLRDAGLAVELIDPGKTRTLRATRGEV